MRINILNEASFYVNLFSSWRSLFPLLTSHFLLIMLIHSSLFHATPSTSSLSVLFFVHSTKLQISTERWMPHHQQCESGGSTATTVVVKCCFVSIVSSFWIVPTANSVVVGCCRGGRTQQQRQQRDKKCRAITKVNENCMLSLFGGEE